MDLFGNGIWRASIGDSWKDDPCGVFVDSGGVIPPKPVGGERRNFGAIGSERKLERMKREGGSSFLLNEGWEKKDGGGGVSSTRPIFEEVWSGFMRAAENQNSDLGKPADSTMPKEGASFPSQFMGPSEPMLDSDKENCRPYFGRSVNNQRHFVSPVDGGFGLHPDYEATHIRDGWHSAGGLYSSSYADSSSMIDKSRHFSIPDTNYDHWDWGQQSPPGANNPWMTGFHAGQQCMTTPTSPLTPTTGMGGLVSPFGYPEAVENSKYFFSEGNSANLSPVLMKQKPLRDSFVTNPEANNFPVRGPPPGRLCGGSRLPKLTYSALLSDGSDLCCDSGFSSVGSSSMNSPEAGAVPLSRAGGGSRTSIWKRNQLDMEDFITTYGHGEGSEHPISMIRPRKGKYFKDFNLKGDE